MIYIKSNEHNIINNYNDKVKMILRSRLEANIKYVVTTSYSAIKMGFLGKIDNVSGSNVIKKVLHWRSSKMSVTKANQCRARSRSLKGSRPSVPHGTNFLSYKQWLKWTEGAAGTVDQGHSDRDVQDAKRSRVWGPPLRSGGGGLLPHIFLILVWKWCILV